MMSNTFNPMAMAWHNVANEYDARPLKVINQKEYAGPASEKDNALYMLNGATPLPETLFSNSTPGTIDKDIMKSIQGSSAANKQVLVTNALKILQYAYDYVGEPSKRIAAISNSPLSMNEYTELNAISREVVAAIEGDKQLSEANKRKVINAYTLLFNTQGNGGLLAEKAINDYKSRDKIEKGTQGFWNTAAKYMPFTNVQTNKKLYDTMASTGNFDATDIHKGAKDNAPFITMAYTQLYDSDPNDNAEAMRILEGYMSVEEKKRGITSTSITGKSIDELNKLYDYFKFLRDACNASNASGLNGAMKAETLEEYDETLEMITEAMSNQNKGGKDENLSDYLQNKVDKALGWTYGRAGETINANKEHKQKVNDKKKASKNVKEYNKNKATEDE